VKQLWVSAFDQAPKPGADPSHAPFHLPGQETATTIGPDGPLDAINSRGYWALSPCKGDGQNCQSGSDCCGGYCVGADGGTNRSVCQATSGGCSHDGDRCSSVANCCNSTDLCINGFCAQQPNQ
jgi:hypothetical protein